MKVLIKDIRPYKTSVLIKFNITPESLAEIDSKKLFNYNKELLDKDPPIQFSNGSIEVIAAPKYTANFKIDEESNLVENKFQVLNLTIDDQQYTSFYQMRLEGRADGELTDAMINFSIQRSSQNKVIPKEHKANIHEILTTMVKNTEKGELGEKSIEKVCEDFVINTANQIEYDEAKNGVESYLKHKHIPLDLQNGSYFFTVGLGKFNWFVKLEIEKPVAKLILVSSIEIKTSENLNEQIKNDFNRINQEIEDGEYRIDSKKMMIMFTNELTPDIFALNEQLEQLFQHNFEAMRIILNFITERYTDKISIENNLID